MWSIKDMNISSTRQNNTEIDLIVIIARDENVKRLKNIVPMHDENVRKQHVEDTGIPDEVVLGSLGNPYKRIEELKPDVICLGYDQEFFAERITEELVKMNVKAKVIRLGAYKPHRYKSSIIKNKIIEKRSMDSPVTRP